MPILPEPAWIVAKVDQRLAMIRAAVIEPDVVFADHAIVMTPLVEPDDGATPKEIEQWDQTCDKCGRYVPGQLYTGSLQRMLDHVRVLLTFGVCEPCRRQDEIDAKS